MPSTSYTVIDGEVVHENRAGTERDYVPDPLGSTVALLNSSQAKTDTFSYWPYGESNTRTGTTATPFQFVGTLGYYLDSSSLTYVRARSYRQDQGRWLTPDPSGFSDGPNVYEYCLQRPVTWVDPSGLAEIIVKGASLTGSYHAYILITGKNRSGQYVTLFFRGGRGKPVKGCPLGVLWADTGVYTKGVQGSDYIDYVEENKRPRYQLLLKRKNGRSTTDDGRSIEYWQAKLNRLKRRFNATNIRNALCYESVGTTYANSNSTVRYALTQLLGLPQERTDYIVGTLRHANFSTSTWKKADWYTAWNNKLRGLEK
jgi:RHS repeat-associated protein